MFGFIFGMMGRQAEADEVFQEVWYRVIRRVDTYRDRNFPGWIVRIAHNLIIDRARRRKPEVSLDEDEFGGIEIAILQQDALQTMAAKELGEKITAAAETLPQAQKEVFLMRTQMDLPFREIARIQKTSINTALARMHYALGKLRQLLQDEYREVAGLDGAGNTARHTLPREA